MSGGGNHGLIDPDAIPGTDVNTGGIAEYASTISKSADPVRTQGGQVLSQWQGLGAVYTAPESDQLLSVMAPVGPATDDLANIVNTMGKALATFASDADAPVKALIALKAQAKAFIASSAVVHGVANPEYVDPTKPGASVNKMSQEGPPKPKTIPWYDDATSVKKNNALVDGVKKQLALLEAARAKCENTINGANGDYRRQQGGPVKPITLSQMDKPGEQLPWGADATAPTPCYQEVWSDAVNAGKGLVNLQLTSMIFNPTNGKWFDWQDTANAWGGLGRLGLAIITPAPIAVIAATTNWLPKPVSDFINGDTNTLISTGKSMVGWDKWSTDPSAASGDVIFTGATFLIPGAGEAGDGASAAAHAAAEGGDAAGVTAADAAKAAADAEKGGADIGETAAEAAAKEAALAGKAATTAINQTEGITTHLGTGVGDAADGIGAGGGIHLHEPTDTGEGTGDGAAAGRHSTGDPADSGPADANPPKHASDTSSNSEASHGDGATTHEETPADTVPTDAASTTHGDSASGVPGQTSGGASDHSVVHVPGTDKTIDAAAYSEARAMSVHNPDATDVMLGRFDGGGDTSYVKQAQDAGYEYFDMGSDGWNDVEKAQGLDDADMFKVYNVPFLDDAMEAGKVFHFSHDPEAYPGTALEGEFDHIIGSGKYVYDPLTQTAIPKTGEVG